MYLSKNIRHLRKKQIWTQTDLGEQLGVKKETVSAYERGTGIPSFDVLTKLTQIFQVSYDDLILRDLELEGIPKPEAAAEQLAVVEEKSRMELRLIELLEQRVHELEREIAKKMPGVAHELGIKEQGGAEGE